MEMWVDAPKKAEEKRTLQPDMAVVTVDLGVNRLAVMGAFLNSRLIAAKFIHGGTLNHHRHQLLRVINNKRTLSIRLQPSVQDNASLWEKVRNLDDNLRGRLPRRLSASPRATAPKSLYSSICVSIGHRKKR